jgi:hypothetical protein
MPELIFQFLADSIDADWMWIVEIMMNCEKMGREGVRRDVLGEGIWTGCGDDMRWQDRFPGSSMMSM